MPSLSCAKAERTQNHDMTFPKYPPTTTNKSCFASISRTTYTSSLPILSASYSISFTQAFSVLFSDLDLLSPSQAACFNIFFFINRACEGVAAWHLFFSFFSHFLTYVHACSVFTVEDWLFWVPGTSRSHIRSAFMICGLGGSEDCERSGVEGIEGIRFG